VAIGQFDKGLAVLDETIRQVEANGDLVHMPEALRVKGRVLLLMPQRHAYDAENYFIESLAWSRRQGARSWELRTATDLAALWAAQGQQERARVVLQTILDTFVEGWDTADLKSARHMLTTL
jgi:predicted ATPase